MKIHPFAINWRASFGDALPVGFLCRDTFAHRWLRIHSLPDSKRYAETDIERAELLRRQNAVASHVLSEGAGCALVVTRFGEDSEWTPYEAPSLAEMTFEHALSVSVDEDEFQFFSTPVVWHKTAFDELILDVADDRTGHLLFANLQNNCIYAPYDGGADLFFSSRAEVALARIKFQLWLSAREDGL